MVDQRIVYTTYILNQLRREKMKKQLTKKRVQISKRTLKRLMEPSFVDKHLPTVKRLGLRLIELLIEGQ